MMRARLSALLLLVGVACTQPATQLVVVVATDYKVPEVLASLDIEVEVDGARASRTLPIGDGALPFSFGVAPPEGGARGPARIAVLALGPDGGLLSTHRATVAFVSGKSLRLPMVVAARCAREICGPSETCGAAGCAPDAVDAATLDEVSPGSELDGLPPPTPTPSPPPPSKGRQFELAVSTDGEARGLVRSVGSGLIECGMLCRALVLEGTLVGLEAVPSPGFRFSAWSGACADKLAGPCVVVMNEAVWVGAMFVEERSGQPGMTDPRDVDGDGRPDLVFAAPHARGAGVAGGRVFVVGLPFNDAISPSGATYRWEGRDDDRLGTAIAQPGDLDDDGVADLLLGAPGAEGGRGAVHVTGGRPWPTDSTTPPGRVIRGSESGESFGAALAVLPDLYGDGRAEFAVGAPGSAVNPRNGRVYIFASGPSPTSTATLVLEGETPGDGFGTSIAWLGDVDGTGGYLAVSAPNDVFGRIYIFRAPFWSGNRNAADAEVKLSGSRRAGRLGPAIASLRDWDSDGRPDFALASSTVGRVFVYAGGATLLSGSVDEAPIALDVGPAAAATLLGPGDVYGDRSSDLVVGIPSLDGPTSGGVLVFLGGSESSTRPAVRLSSSCVRDGTCQEDAVGVTLAPLDDWDGDGKADFAVGSRYGGLAAGPAGRGRIAFVSNVAPGSSSIDSAPTVIVGEEEPGMCVVMPGSQFIDPGS
jgi:hypothetical protein